MSSNELGQLDTSFSQHLETGVSDDSAAIVFICGSSLIHEVLPEESEEEPDEKS